MQSTLSPSDCGCCRHSGFGVRKPGPPILDATRAEFLAREPQYLHLQNKAVLTAPRQGEVGVCLFVLIGSSQLLLPLPPKCRTAQVCCHGHLYRACWEWNPGPIGINQTFPVYFAISVCISVWSRALVWHGCGSHRTVFGSFFSPFAVGSGVKFSS